MHVVVDPVAFAQFEAVKVQVARTAPIGFLVTDCRLSRTLYSQAPRAVVSKYRHCP
jgi:hypothetical protein